MAYTEKLKDPRWQKKRLQVMSRDDFKCQLCGSDKNTLHVHHKSYNGEPWESEDSELITLCEDCHLMTEEFHEFNLIKAVKSDFTCGSFYFVAFETKNKRRGIFIVCVEKDKTVNFQLIVETEFDIIKELMSITPQA